MAPQRGTPPPRRCTMTMELLRVPQSRKTPAPRVQGTVRQVAGRGEIRQFPTSAVRDTVAARHAVAHDITARDIAAHEAAHEAVPAGDTGRAMAPSSPPVSMPSLGGLPCFGATCRAFLTGTLHPQLVWMWI